MIVDLQPIQAGFCDRLRRLTFAVALAKLRGDAELVIRDGPNRWCPYRFLDLMGVSGMQCRAAMADDPPMEEQLYRSHSGPSRDIAALMRPPDLAVATAKLAKAWKHAYRVLVPSSAISLRLSSLDLAAHKIGLHVRVTDKLAENPDPSQIGLAELERYERAAFRHVLRRARAHGTGVFLACDNPESRLAWTERFASARIPVLTSGARFVVGGLRLTDGEDFGTDLFALSRCSVTYGLVRSGVVQSAARMGGAKSVVLKDRSPRVALRWLGRKLIAKVAAKSARRKSRST